MYDSYRKVHKIGDPKRDGYLFVFAPFSLLADSVLGTTLGPSLATTASSVDSILGLIPAAVFKYEGLLYKGMSSITKEYGSGVFERITTALEVDRVLLESGPSLQSFGSIISGLQVPT